MWIFSLFLEFCWVPKSIFIYIIISYINFLNHEIKIIKFSKILNKIFLLSPTSNNVTTWGACCKIPNFKFMFLFQEILCFMAASKYLFKFLLLLLFFIMFPKHWWYIDVDQQGKVMNILNIKSWINQQTLFN